MWFEKWKVGLVDIGFTEKDEDRTVGIRNEKLKYICNLDEMCIPLDVGNGNRGGRMEAVFFGPRFPLRQKVMIKTSRTTTIIGGSTAEGEALLPHLKFQTKAQSDDTHMLRNEMVEWLPNVRGKFG